MFGSLQVSELWLTCLVKCSQCHQLRVLFKTCEFHTVPHLQALGAFAASKLCQQFLTPTRTVQTEREIYEKIVDLFILTPSLGYNF